MFCVRECLNKECGMNISNVAGLAGGAIGGAVAGPLGAMVGQAVVQQAQQAAGQVLQQPLGAMGGVLNSAPQCLVGGGVKL
jgi:hypothetical protein